MRPRGASLFLAWTFFALAPCWAQGQRPSNSAWMMPPSETKLLKEEVSIPMEQWGGRPIISAKINGKGPYRFILDTGSSVTAIIDREVIREVGIETGEKISIPGMGGDAATIESLTFDDLDMTGVHAVASDVGKFVGRDKTSPRGILGIRLFADCLLTFDFPGKRFLVRTGELPAPGGEIVEYQDMGAISFQIHVAGTMISAHMDTGSPGDLLLTTFYEKKIPLTGEPIPSGRLRTPMGGADVRSATVDGVLTIGDHEFTNPKVRFADLPQMTAMNFGNVGSGLLKFFAITFDQQNLRLRFHFVRQE